MTAKKAAKPSPTDYLGGIEQSATHVKIAEERVRSAQEHLGDADVVLEQKRARTWELLGPPFGAIRLGNWRFSRLMLIVTAAVLGMVFGSIFIGPTIGALLVLITVIIGAAWLRGKF